MERYWRIQMEQVSPWNWFHTLVVDVEPGLRKFGFQKDHFYGFPRDDDWKIHGGCSYRSTIHNLIDIDILQRDEIHADPIIEYYWVRASVNALPPPYQLKLFLYPDIRVSEKNVELWQGWIGYSREDVKEILIEIVAGLDKYWSKE
jgi:hypothetical protein